MNDEWFHNEERVRQAVGLLSIQGKDDRASAQPSPRRTGQPGPTRAVRLAGSAFARKCCAHSLWQGRHAAPALLLSCLLSCGECFVAALR